MTVLTGVFSQVYSLMTDDWQVPRLQKNNRGFKNPRSDLGLNSLGW
jgi:hypothetical protein